MTQNQVVRTTPFDQLRVVPTWVDRLFPKPRSVEVKVGRVGS